MENLILEQNDSPNYKYRTEVNVKKSDLTIAIAFDFESFGEKLTKDLAKKNNKKYIAVIPSGSPKEKAELLIDKINSFNLPGGFTLNIAGNGLSTIGDKMNQLEADEYTYELIKTIGESDRLISKIGIIRSGGQSGFDESGAKASLRLGITTIVHMPLGFKIRMRDGKDIIMSKEHARLRFVKTDQIIRKIVYIDMDDTLCDYSGLKQEYSIKFPDVIYPQSKFGFFSRLKPIDGALEAVKKLEENNDVYILTRPSIKNLHSYSEKAEWVERYLGESYLERLILCPNKSLVKGDFLIDDYDKNGQTEFEGEFLKFKTEKFPDWDAILKYILK